MGNAIKFMSTGSYAKLPKNQKHLIEITGWDTQTKITSKNIVEAEIPDDGILALDLIKLIKLDE
jgi:hypothetical protein